MIDTARHIRRLAALCVGLFAILAGATFYWGFVRAETLAARPDNPRRASFERRIARGRLLDRHGAVLAETSFDADGEPVRRYPIPAAAPVVGFQTWRYGAGGSPDVTYGAGGAEAAYDAALRGDLGLSLRELLLAQLLHRPQRGHDVVLTLDAGLQAYAAELLGDREGAVVVLDVETGAVRALVSQPTFDPAALDEGKLNADDPRRPLLNRATQGLYPPGSIWKTVTLAAALDEGLVKPGDMVTDGDAEEYFGGFGVRCNNNPEGVNSFDIAHAYAYSCNVTFARLADALGASRFGDHARRFGIGDAPPFPLPTVRSLVSLDDELSPAELASAGFGQGEILVTPLAMALVGAAVAARWNAAGAPPPIRCARGGPSCHRRRARCVAAGDPAGDRAPDAGHHDHVGGGWLGPLGRGRPGSHRRGQDGHGSAGTRASPPRLVHWLRPSPGAAAGHRRAGGQRRRRRHRRRTAGGAGAGASPTPGGTTMSHDHETYQSPFTWRYGSAAMRALWSEAHKRRLMRQVWLALAEAQAAAGLVRPDQLAQLRATAEDIDIPRAAEIEATTQHDVMAELLTWREQAPLAGGSLHLGATSADITDNVDALRLKTGLSLVRAALANVMGDLADRVVETADLATLGWTHLQPAAPTTVGYRLAATLQDFLSDLHQLDVVAAEVRGKGFKGAVGTAASYTDLLAGTGLTPAQMEADAMGRLGLAAYPVTTQVYPRKADLLVLNALAGVAATASLFAFHVRLMQSPPFGEWHEGFAAGQVGSSAMPWKRNPIHAENIDSLARFVAALPAVAWQNETLTLLERTLDDSANRRIVHPEAFLATDEILRRTRTLVQRLAVAPDAVAATLDRFGPFAAAERVLLAAAAAGGDRQTLHERIRRHSLTAWAATERGEENPLPRLLAEDVHISRYVETETVLALMAEARAHVGDAPERARALAATARRALAGRANLADAPGPTSERPA